MGHRIETIGGVGLFRCEIGDNLRRLGLGSIPEEDTFLNILQIRIGVVLPSEVGTLLAMNIEAKVELVVIVDGDWDFRITDFFLGTFDVDAAATSSDVLVQEVWEVAVHDVVEGRWLDATRSATMRH